MPDRDEDQDEGIVRRDGCVLVYGPLSVSSFARAARLLPRRAVMDPHLARLAGAGFAMGLPDDTARLAETLAPEARARVDRSYPGMSSHAREWLATGRQGSSSLALFSWLMGIGMPTEGGADLRAIPRDGADLARCRLMLEAVPAAAQRFDRAADMSPEWADLVGSWQRICRTMDDEAPGWREGAGRCDATNAMLAAIGTASPPAPGAR